MMYKGKLIWFIITSDYWVKDGPVIKGFGTSGQGNERKK